MYDCAFIHVGINYILRSKNNEIKNLPDDRLEIAYICQNFNIGKIFNSAISSLKRSKINIVEINEALKNLFSRNNFLFIK